MIDGESLWRRAGLSTNISTFILLVLVNLNPFGTGWGISTFFDANHCKTAYEFQSLWSRAESFDLSYTMFMQAVICFNSFEAGRGLSTIDERKPPKYTISFNPFRAGQGLSTPVLSDQFSMVSKFQSL